MGLAAAAVLFLFGPGLTGCGANGYAGMSRAASGEIAFADAAGGVEWGNHGAAAMREVSAVQAGAGIEGRTTSGMSGGSTSAQRANSPKVSVIGEATMAAKAVSSLKTRKVLGVQSLSCANQSMTGAGSTTCTLTLSSAAPSGGLVVTVSSNNAALSVPASVAVSAGSSRATFAATAAAVSTTQMANITANASGSVTSAGIQLNAFNPALSISSTTVSFGAVSVGQTATSSVTLTSAGNAPLTISSISVSGSLFKATGLTTPLTLNPGQTAVLTLQFYSDHVSSFTGLVTIASNAAQGAATINMSADGVASALAGLTCTDAVVTGSETDGCVVSLSGAAPAGGVAVVLSSSNASVSVPASVVVPAGASSASFATAISAVSSVQAATITGTANGCSRSFGIQLNVSAPALTVSSTTVAFGGVVVGQTATSMVTLTSSGNAPLTISSISVAGSLFKATGVNTPLTLNPGQTAGLTLQFYSDHTSSFSGIVTIASNAAQGAATINMSGDGVPALSGLTCSAQSYAGAGTDSCVVSLYGTATSAGFAVSLASNNASVVVPASVTVAAGAMSASFSATVNAVSTGQTVTLSATAGGVSKSFALQLGPASAVLTANASTIPFGSVLVDSPAEQPITLTASGSGPVTISSVSITGVGFSLSGLTAPLTLNPGQTSVVNVQFTPTAAGSYSGQVAIGSNASGGTIAIGLSGTGYKHSVQLGWSAPSSGTVAGYNVYRALSGSTAYQRVNTAALSATTFSDGNVQSGASYSYYVKSVDGSGVESNPSNTTTLSIPIP